MHSNAEPCVPEGQSAGHEGWEGLVHVQQALATVRRPQRQRLLLQDCWRVAGWHTHDAG